ncbi:expressed unknown protein [Ectocarpus siliculosus]|uniref:Uncharacterized protein n=1 Tax=Ectocarpus siliculosus TaxID=2880 RepID=D7G6T0_ECTSI|nr:expressed unknown protein [Ectocarpus siliculosus]|eukprot:CBJ33978.1 expressed unknown protein [Ectocarpus siliculosus]
MDNKKKVAYRRETDSQASTLCLSPPRRCGDVVTIDTSRAETAQVAPHYGLGRCGLWD